MRSAPLSQHLQMVCASRALLFRAACEAWRTAADVARAAAWGFSSAAQPGALQQGATAARGAWAAQLEQSQAFHAPDCVERMARVYGVAPVRWASGS